MNQHQPPPPPKGRDGHLDTRSSLYDMLENRAPSAPELVTVAQYNQWDESARAAFNVRRVDRIAKGFVFETSQIEELRRELRLSDAFSRRPVGRTGVILSGPAASGKTTAAMQGMVDGMTRHSARYPDWKELGHHPVVYVEVPPGSTGRAIMGRFLLFLEVPLSLFQRMTLEERTQLVRAHLTQGHTSLIVIDEMHNLSHLTAGQFESAQAIKNLLNAVPAVPLYAGLNLDKILRGTELGEQFAARSACVRLGNLQFGTPDEVSRWRGVIHGFEMQFALFSHPPRTLFPHAAELWLKTLGSLAALSRLLITAALDLIAAGRPESETITIEQLRTIKLDLATEGELERGLTAARTTKGKAP